MAASVRYWRLPEEEGDFARFLESLEPTLVFPHQLFSTAEEVRWYPVHQAFQCPSTRLFITPARFVPLARISFVEAVSEKGYTVDHTKSPVLFYLRGSLEGSRLHASVLSSQWTHLANGGKAFADHPADFVRWAKKVMQWVRKVAPLWYEHKAHRLTPKVEAARQSGLELIS